MTNINNINETLANLLKANMSVIKKTTPSNPPIKKDDEWRNETCWDKLYKEMSIK